MSDGLRAIEVSPEYSIGRLVELGERAEAVGFDAVFASSHYNNRDPLIACTQIANATEEVWVGPGIVNPYETHPAVLATRLATLEEVSQGRAVCGIGPGDPTTLGNLGIERERPLRRTLEAFTVMRNLWAGEEVTHEGTFETQDAALNYHALGAIPVFVGAQGPHMLRMSAKHADGVLYNGSHPDDVEWAAERVAEGLDERGSDGEGFEFAAFASVSVAEDPERAIEAARPPVAYIVAGAPEPVLARHGIDANYAKMMGSAIAEGAYIDAFQAVTEDMIEAFCVAGTPEDVADGLADLLEHADGVVVGSPLGPNLDEAVGLAAEALSLTPRE